jgi:hypothetical protein
MALAGEEVRVKTSRMAVQSMAKRICANLIRGPRRQIIDGKVVCPLADYTLVRSGRCQGCLWLGEWAENGTTIRCNPPSAAVLRMIVACQEDGTTLCQ